MLKSKAKGKAVDVRKERGKTRGGENVAGELSEQEMRIVSVIGEACVQWVTGGFDLNQMLLQKLVGT